MEWRKDGENRNVVTAKDAKAMTTAKMKLVRVIRWKLLFVGEEMTLLIAEDVNLLSRTVLVGKISLSLAVGWDFTPSLQFLIKV